MAFIQFQLRRGTAAEWTSANPTLAAGEMGVETDTGKFKIGDGSTDWNTLTYGGLVGATGATGPTGPQGEQGPVGTGLELLGVLNDESELPGSGDPEPTVGDAYLIGTVLYVWDGFQFVSADLKGPQGDPGEPGTGGGGDGFAFQGEFQFGTPYDEGDLVLVSDQRSGQNDVVDSHRSLYRALDTFEFGTNDPKVSPEQWELVAGFERGFNQFNYVGLKDPQVDEFQFLDVFHEGPGTGLFLWVGQPLPYGSARPDLLPNGDAVFADPVEWAAGEYQDGLLVERTFGEFVTVWLSTATTSGEPGQSEDWFFVDVRPRVLIPIALGSLGSLSDVFVDPQFLNGGEVLTWNANFNTWSPQAPSGEPSAYMYGGWEVNFGDGETFLQHFSPSFQPLNPIYLPSPGIVDVTLAMWDGQDPSDPRVVQYTFYVNGSFSTQELSSEVLAASTDFGDVDLVLEVSDNQQDFVFNIINIKLTHTGREFETWPVFVSVQPRTYAAISPDQNFGS